MKNDNKYIFKRTLILLFVLIIIAQTGCNISKDMKHCDKCSYILIDFSEILDHNKIKSITVIGGTLSSIHYSIEDKNDIKRFCEMFDFWFDPYMIPGSMICEEEPQDKENIEFFNETCLISILYQDSSEVLLISINTDNTFNMQKDGMIYKCNNPYFLDYEKILYFR